MHPRGAGRLSAQRTNLLWHGDVGLKFRERPHERVATLTRDEFAVAYECCSDGRSVETRCETSLSAARSCGAQHFVRALEFFESVHAGVGRENGVERIARVRNDLSREPCCTSECGRCVELKRPAQSFAKFGTRTCGATGPKISNAGIEPRMLMRFMFRWM